MVPFEMDAIPPKHPEVLRINPKRQVPVLIDGDLELFDSTQIFEYLETFSPRRRCGRPSRKARARARLLEHKSDEVYFPHDRPADGPAGHARRPAASRRARPRSRFYDGWRGAGRRDFLAGSYSFADIAFYMAQCLAIAWARRMTDAHRSLQAWRDRMSARPAVRQVAGAMGRYLLSQGRKLPAFLAKLSTASP